jgi:hydrogenase maturation protein HypF
MKRLLIRVSGIVQGVGFRPFVHAFARKCGLNGFVRNEGDGVLIEAEGPDDAVARFRDALSGHPPEGALVADVVVAELPLRGECGFAVEPSRASAGGSNFAPADGATCPECLAELFDPQNRRYRYPFISCSRCGPRFTVFTALPYDRERTTMAAFPLCAECRREYEDPADRRFHAQSIACPVCGPQLALLDRAADTLALAVSALQHGEVVAVKGLGGYHLACDARNADAVARLRRRKHRDQKPFAVMIADPDAARALCEVAPAEAEFLASPARPIVLLKRRPGAAVAEPVAPGNPLLGVMLAYTPLHHLLLRDFGGPLVMTSGNRSDEPIACDDADARRRLADIADLFLAHDRPIRSRCDDSVARIVAGAPVFVRRSRGYTPLPLALPLNCDRPVLAVGGQLKSVFALGRDRRALLSQYHGDLDGYEAFRAFAETVTDFERLFRFRPEMIAHDLHPDYGSTRYALDRAAESGVRLVAVQHHHAHMAACMAENGLNEPVIGVTFDGTGYGPDGTIWGGEFLVGDYRSFTRGAHLRPVPLPGGDAAVRQPWRAAVAHLIDAGQDPKFLFSRVRRERMRCTFGAVCQRVIRGPNSPFASSAGRLFDVVATLVGREPEVTYEGQAAVELEARATGTAPDGCYPFALDARAEGEPLQVDTRPLIAAVVADLSAGALRELVARRFHTTLATIIADVCRTLRTETGLNAVVLSGGCFLNALLLTDALDRLAGAGFRVYRHTLVPPGDGGLCLGQLVVATARESCENPPAPSS